MSNIIAEFNKAQKKVRVPEVRSGDTVRVYQRIREGNKERVQMFEGLVIRTDRKQSHSSRITVRRVASGVGVEKSFLVHSPLVEKIEVVRRSNVRRNFLSYMRQRSGKSARLASVDFDRAGVNEADHGRAAKAEDQPLEEATDAADEAADKPTA